ncbi:MAG TPA: hypothetical protein VM429_00445, partial [Micropruina sp.]|nr:hypothetical protein [Micropruina sp.]
MHRCGKGAMCRPAPDVIALVIRRRPDQWVTKLDAVVDQADDAAPLRRLEDVDTDASKGQRPDDLTGIAGIARGREEQRITGVHRQPVKLPGECLLQSNTHGQRSGDRSPAEEFCLGQGRYRFEQGERVAVRLGDELAAHGWVDLPPAAPHQERRMLSGQPAQLEGAKSSRGDPVAVPHGQQQEHVFVAQSASGEEQGFPRRRVQPV